MKGLNQLLSCLIFVQAIHADVSLVDYNNAIDAINDLLEGSEGTNGVRRDRPLIAQFVRMAFHDCVGPGGCDGCINVAINENKGLEAPFIILQEAYHNSVNNFDEIFSLADFIQLAAEVALVMSTKDQTDSTQQYNGLSTFKLGRRDCNTSPDENNAGIFPEAQWGHLKTFNFFQNRFSFTDEDTVAILGAHTLGRCRYENTGYEGPWSGPRFSTQNSSGGLAHTSILDNNYYRMVIEQVVWNQLRLNSTSNWQWQQPTHNEPNDPENDANNQHPILLNVDMGISWDFTPVENDPFGEVTCLAKDGGSGTLCPHVDNSIKTYADNFAASNAAFITAFEIAFKKMSEKVKDSVTLTPAPTS